MKIKTITYRVIHGNRVYKMEMKKITHLRLKERTRVSAKLK